MRVVNSHGVWLSIDQFPLTNFFHAVPLPKVERQADAVYRIQSKDRTLGYLLKGGGRDSETWRLAQRVDGAFRITGRASTRKKLINSFQKD